MRENVIIGIDLAGVEKNSKHLPTYGFERKPGNAGFNAHDAVTAALTGYLYLHRKTDLIGDEEEGYIVVPTRSEWRRLML